MWFVIITSEKNALIDNNGFTIQGGRAATFPLNLLGWEVDVVNTVKLRRLQAVLGDNGKLYVAAD
ncbi:1011_t:CDS:2, partial [Acaulospora colombiana]